MRIATFNVQNLRLRRRAGGLHLDGARDGDVAEDVAPWAEALDGPDRRLTAAVLAEARADVVALQEVFDAETLAHFHDAYLLPAGVAGYPVQICLPGNDGRGLDVALLARCRPDEVRSHAAVTAADLGLEGRAPDRPVFRRDCLMVRFGGLRLWLCHFKAPYPDPLAAWEVQRQEALAVRRLIEAEGVGGLWMILGDLNDPATPPDGRPSATAPLRAGFAVDLLERLAPEERWTWHDPGGTRYASPDAMLASPALAAAWPEALPRILRAGLGREAARHPGPRIPGTGLHRPHASDHALVMVDLPGL